jgi:hypothetical protein
MEGAKENQRYRKDAVVTVCTLKLQLETCSNNYLFCRTGRYKNLRSKAVTLKKILSVEIGLQIKVVCVL